MSDAPRKIEPFFIGPDGKRITLADLPSRGLLNLSPAQKATVVAGVCHGLLTLSEACERYHLSFDEYLDWHRSFAGQRGTPMTMRRVGPNC